ncbi:hypothetical protein, conserved [Eimeria maxima]|uniref:FHA domain-containing protein n=1 Tax=Eimeria maxima TaxID=5804 RepID=U6M9R1_EIMMA|nr:hypothetical protein, conserved [Eimeria maxima]CDJ59219.1 hypothetical protein, conserved [Eimeria maxima]
MTQPNNRPRALAFLRGRRILYQLEHPLLHLGRARSCDITIRCGGISRFHAAFDLTGLHLLGDGRQHKACVICHEGEGPASNHDLSNGNGCRKAFVKDLASLNGTWLNNRRLEPHVWHPLESGDTLMFASADEAHLVFELPAFPGSPSVSRPLKEVKSKDPEKESHSPSKEPPPPAKLLPTKDYSCHRNTPQANKRSSDQRANSRDSDKAHRRLADAGNVIGAAEGKKAAPAEKIVQSNSPTT